MVKDEEAQFLEIYLSECAGKCKIGLSRAIVICMVHQLVFAKTSGLLCCKNSEFTIFPSLFLIGGPVMIC